MNNSGYVYSPALHAARISDQQTARLKSRIFIGSVDGCDTPVGESFKYKFKGLKVSDPNA